MICKKVIYSKICIFLCVLLLTGVFATPVSASTATTDELLDIALGIVNWKKSDVGSDEDGFLISDTFLLVAGTTPGDWYPIGLSRIGISDNFDGYLAVINDNIQKRYQTDDKLDKAKATEWHRITLAVLCSGGNPRRMGENGDIDLIADGVYMRVDSSGEGILGKQGINGFIWGLIAIDSMCYEIPDDAYYTRDDIILNIMNRQLSDGGWALSGDTSDPDITAMAIQALAPYYNSEKKYDYKSYADGSSVSKKVRTAVDEAIAFLSSVQQSDGGFTSWGMPNSESAVQVAVALCSLGIDIFSDTRFIKDGNTIYDGIIKYRNHDGGFLHSFVYDEQNPSSLPDKSNTMASEQALYGIASIMRFQNGMRRLYDLRPEQDAETKAQIHEIMQKIDTLTPLSPIAELKAAYDLYLALEGTERSYVYNYYRLSALIEFAGMEFEAEDIKYNSGDAGVVEAITEFTDVDKKAVDALPTNITTAYRAEVLRLYSKLTKSFDFDGKKQYLIKLEKAKNEIDAIEAEVADIKNEIKQALYPFDSITLSDRNKVCELYERYMALSEYDRALLSQSDAEGLLKAKAQVDALYLAVIIAAAALFVASACALFIVWHIKKRRKAKALAAMPESDD